MFNKLLALLIYHKHNIQILHWKTSGSNFQENHVFLGELYGKMEEHIDIVAELGLQIKSNPITIQAAIKLLENAEKQFIGINPNISYGDEETFTNTINIFKDIIDEIVFIYDNKLNEAQKSTLSSLEEWYRLRAEYLIPRRLM